MRFKPVLSPLLSLVVLALIVAAASNFRRELLNVPRSRVGALVRDEPIAAGAPPSLRLFALGSTGDDPDVQRQVAAAMEARCRATGRVDALLLLGDNGPRGGMLAVDDPQWRYKVQEPYGSPCLGDVPLYPVLGNHDYRGAPVSQIEYSLLEPRWRMPNRFYAVRFGGLLELVAFDSQVSEFCLRPAFCAGDFLLQTLAASTAAWQVVTAYHPLASRSTQGFASRGGWRGRLLAPLLCERADAWIAGHAHHLEHRRSADCRLEQWTSGTGGSVPTPVLPADGDSQFAAATVGFLELDVTPTVLTGRFIDVHGQTLYEARRQR